MRKYPRIYFLLTSPCSQYIAARTAQEAVRIARLAKSFRLRNWVKIEVINDSKYLLPDNAETIKATEILSAEGFVVERCET